ASAGTISASATSDILFPIKLTITDGSMDEPVDIVDKRTYAAIEDKARSGLPTKALWKGGGEFLLHPVPTAAATLKLLYERVADDSSAGSAPDIEVSMLTHFEKIITAECADDFVQSEQKVMRFMAEAKQAQLDIRKLNAQRMDFTPVEVDNWDDRPVNRVRSDYNY